MDNDRALLEAAARAAEMLTAYAEMVKMTGRYAEMHYVPEIEFVIAKLQEAAAIGGSDGH